MNAATRATAGRAIAEALSETGEVALECCSEPTSAERHVRLLIERLGPAIGRALAEMAAEMDEEERGLAAA